MMAVLALPTYESAIEAALANVTTIASFQDLPRQEAIGRVLVEDVVADRDQPPFDRSALDGYAVQAATASGATLNVVETIPAGTEPTVSITPTTCAAIATGAPLPNGADAVVRHEQTDRRDPVTLTAMAISAGDGVHRRGKDAAAGASVITPPAIITARHIAVAATMGCATLRVRNQPKVVILSSGDEVVDPAITPSPCQIRNANQEAIAGIVVAMGGEVMRCLHVADDEGATVAAVQEAIEIADLVITIGGISAGDRDFFTTAVAQSTVTRSVRGAAIRPGKPVCVAHTPEVTVLSLPGNPVSAIVCSVLFGGPILRRMLGLDPALKWCDIALAQDAPSNGSRACFRPALITPTRCVEIPPWQGSGDLIHTAETDGVVWLPTGSECLKAGTIVPFLPWPGGS